MSTMKPKAGEIVFYKLLMVDAKAISDQIHNDETRMHERCDLPEACDVFPMIITQVWRDGTVTGNVLYGGSNVLRVAKAQKGEEAGMWSRKVPPMLEVEEEPKPAQCP